MANKVLFNIVIVKQTLPRHHIRRRLMLTSHLFSVPQRDAELTLKTIKFVAVRVLETNNTTIESIIHLDVLEGVIRFPSCRTDL